MRYPERKHPRLKQYDYSLPGYYYVTIHAERNAPAFSDIFSGNIYCRARVCLTNTVEIIQKQLVLLEQRFSYVKVDKYVIMPTHIHVIVRLLEGTAGASPRPTLMEIVGSFKSLTTRACNQYANTPGRKLFQVSFYETVLRNELAYQECWRYIDENPDKWAIEPNDI